MDLNTLINDTAVAQATVDHRGNIVSANAALCRIAGAAQNELVGKPFSSLLHSSEREAFQANFLLQGGTQQTRLSRNSRLNTDKYGQPCSLLQSMTSDVASSRMQMTISVIEWTNDSMMDGIQNWLDLDNRADEGIAIVDADGHRLKLVSHAFAQMHGYTTRELTGARLSSLTRDTAATSLFQCKNLADHRLYVGKHARKDESEFLVAVEISLIRDSDGEIRWQQLRARNLDTQTATPSSGQIHARVNPRCHSCYDVIRYDTNARIVYTNTAVQKALSRQAPELIGKTPTDLWDHTITNTLQRKINDVLRSGDALDFSVPHPLPADFPVLPIDVRLTPEFDDEGKIKGVVSSCKDLMALQETEQRLIESRTLLRSLIARRDADIERERQYIAREIHDDLGQTLTAMRLRVDLCRLKFAASNPQLDAMIGDIAQLVEQAFRTTRSIGSSLRPPTLDMGLTAALEWLAQNFSDTSGVPCTLNVREDDIDLDDERAIAVFRIVQESLTNISRHANASNVGVVLYRHGGNFELTVSDDGDGFDTEGPHKENSFGLIGIRERAHMLGGRFAIVSSLGEGTAVNVQFPHSPSSHKAIQAKES